VELQGRLQRDVNRINRKEKGCIRNHGGKSAKGPRERGQELKASRHSYNQVKNQDINPEY